MDADNRPSAVTTPVARLLGHATQAILRCPRTALFCGLALALLALLLATAELGFRTSRLDLLNPAADYNRLWIEYLAEFGHQDDAVVVVEGDQPVQVQSALDDIAARLADDRRHFRQVFHKIDLSGVRDKGLHYLSGDQLTVIERFVRGVDPILAGDWSRLSAGSMAAEIERNLTSPRPGTAHSNADGSRQSLDRLCTGLLAALADAQGYRSPWPVLEIDKTSFRDTSTKSLLSNHGRLGVVLVHLAGDQDGFSGDSQAVDALRAAISDVRVRHPGVRIGLTGLPVLENDEMRASQQDMSRATGLSLAAVACIFVAALGSLRHPLSGVAALLIGITWSIGYLTLAVGHLNILSVSFAVILIGLGIDFGIHYTARFLELRPGAENTRAALVRASVAIGPGILIGAVTTALAFFMARLTDFVGIAELGVIAAGGTLLCCLATLTMLPPLILLGERYSRRGRHPLPLDIRGCLDMCFRRPRATVIVTVAATAALAIGAVWLKYDHNLLNLQPTGLESVRWERKLLDESDQSVWYAISLADSRQQLLQRKEQFLAMPSVQRTEEIVSSLPAPDAARTVIIERIGSQLRGLPERPSLVPVDRPAALEALLERLQTVTQRDERLSRETEQLVRIRDALRNLPAAVAYTRVSDFQQRAASDLLNRLHGLRVMTAAPPPVLADLPDDLVSRFHSSRGRHLLKVYARGDIWDMESLAGFVRDVRGVDPRATGQPLQTYFASGEMKAGYQQAALYALAAIGVVLVVSFRGMRDALLALVPIALAVPQLLGLCGLLGIPINPANMIVLPLLLGIGVDDGVHIVHDWRRGRGPYRISRSTAAAVLLTSLTTMAGFGSLMIADHQGLNSLGRVMTIGISCCLLNSLVTLPAILSCLGSADQDRSRDEAVTAAHHLDRRRRRVTAGGRASSFD